MEKLHISLKVGVVIFYVAAGISIAAIISPALTNPKVSKVRPVQALDASVLVDSNGEIPISKANGSGAARPRHKGH